MRHPSVSLKMLAIASIVALGGVMSRPAAAQEWGGWRDHSYVHHWEGPREYFGGPEPEAFYRHRAYYHPPHIRHDTPRFWRY